MQSGLGKTFAFSSFVFDLRTRELRRKGHSVHMSDQISRLLAILIEHRGQLVTREDLIAHLWPDGEAIDYDRSINRAVSQLRATLKDRRSRSAECAYIATLSGRGYRFIGELREVPSVPFELRTVRVVAPGAIESDPVTSPLAETHFAMTQTTGPQPIVSQISRTSSRRRATSWIISFGIMLILVLAIVFAWKAKRKPPLAIPHILSMGIVPFESSGEGANLLAESFRLDLADSLSQIPQLQIRAAHSFDHMEDESQIERRAREFGIETLLLGKFTQNGNVCQLRLELVRSRDGVHLFSLQYAGTKEQLGSIRDRIEKDLFERLRLTDQSSQLTLLRPSYPQAYVAYLHGRAYLQEWTDESLGKAITLFQEAIRIDPNYARAYAAEASAYCILAEHGFGDRTTELRLARVNATRALAIEPSLAEAHATLGQIALSYDWNFVAAEEELRRATELDPSRAMYHQWLSILFCTEHKFDLAFSEIERAHAADPDWTPPYLTEIYIAGNAHQYVRADKAASILLSKRPDWPIAHEQNAMNLWAWGHGLAAIEEWHKAALLDKNFDRAHLEEIGAADFAKGGVRAYAKGRLEAIASGKGISMADYDFIPAEWHAYAGEWDAALDDLDKLMASRSPEATEVSTNPAYAPLHKNARFVAMLKQAGLPLPPESQE